jgi:hypothetical protein
VFRFELHHDDDDVEVGKFIYRYRRNGYVGLSMVLAYPLKNLLVVNRMSSWHWMVVVPAEVVRCKAVVALDAGARLSETPLRIIRRLGASFVVRT